FRGSSTHTMDCFWELATLILFMLLGNWIEMNAVGNAGNALKKLAELLPNTAVKLIDNKQREEVKISEINIDDIVDV
ncbi:heavy metal translocating P-type ATPase, partial [Listeria monocytogenes]|nr:heavy metal translocating P-type ATPase [Listeria monocytogenes]